MAAVTFKSFKEFKKMEGKLLPKGEWVTVTQEMINAFALATQDYQWIHMDADRAKKESPFGTPIAHGFLSLALVSSMLSGMIELTSMKMGMNYGLDRVRFPSPVPVNSRLRLGCRIGQIQEMENKGLKVAWNCEVEMENSDRPACVCELIAVVFE